MCLVPPVPQRADLACRYPTTVATLSRRSKDIIEQSFERTSADGVASPLVNSRLQDFGFRGCTCVEQSIIGGCAHLLNFVGTDTMSAAYYAQVSAGDGCLLRSVPSMMTAFICARGL